MSQVMSAETEALAAEYVLGTLDSAERAQASSLLAADEAFVAKVKVWERRLGELHLMVEPVEPDGRIWQPLKAKMPEVVVPVVETKPPEPEPEPASVAAPGASPQPPAAAEPASSVPSSLPPAATFEAAIAAATEPLAPSPAPTPPSTEAAPSSAEAAPPSAEATPRTLVAPSPPVTAPEPPPAAPVLTPSVVRAPSVEPQQDTVAVLRGRLTRWRMFAGLLILVVLGVATLVAAWRFAPDRLPPILQPVQVMRLIGI